MPGNSIPLYIQQLTEDMTTLAMVTIAIYTFLHSLVVWWDVGWLDSFVCVRI